MICDGHLLFVARHVATLLMMLLVAVTKLLSSEAAMLLSSWSTLLLPSLAFEQYNNRQWLMQPPAGTT